MRGLLATRTLNYDDVISGVNHSQSVHGSVTAGSTKQQARSQAACSGNEGNTQLTRLALIHQTGNQHGATLHRWVSVLGAFGAFAKRSREFPGVSIVTRQLPGHTNESLQNLRLNQR